MKQKVIYMLMSLLVAFGIWSYVVTVVSPESEATYYNVPVILSNESALTDKGLMVTDGAESTVTLHLRGNRADLNKLKNSDITVVADLSKINAAGVQLLNCDVTFAGSPNAYEILNQNPGQIVVDIAEWAAKEIPVNVYCNTTGMKPNYIAHKNSVIQDYDTINITGPKDVVDRIAEARIEIDLNETHTETLNQSYRYTLCDEEGLPVDVASIKTNAAEVNVTVKIQKVKDLQLVVDVIYGGGANQDNTTVTLNYQTIKVAGSEKLINSLADTLVLGSVDLTQIAEDAILTLPVKLPEGVENLSGVKEVDVSISFANLETRTVAVSRILVTNVPGGMHYDTAKVVNVTVRGPEDLIQAITADNLSVVVDLTNGAVGSEVYNAQILVDTDFQDRVGVIGSYEVTVTLSLEDAA